MVRGDLQEKYLIGDNWSLTATIITLNYLFVYPVKHKARVHQLYFIRAFLPEKIKNRVFVKLDSRYAPYFPEYSSYFGIDRPLVLITK